MTDILERLLAYNMADFDTSASLTRDRVPFADVTLIRDASDLTETIHEAAAEIARLRAEIAALAVAKCEAQAKASRLEHANGKLGTRLTEALINAGSAELRGRMAAINDMIAQGLACEPGAGLGERGA